MKKFNIIYYDNEGYLYEEIIYCRTYEDAEEHAVNHINRAYERAEENFEDCFINDFKIVEIIGG